MSGDMKRLLIPGAAGQIGRALRAGLRGHYSLIRLTDIAPLGSAEAGEDAATADLRDMSAVEEAASGIHCVVLLGGVSVEDVWEEVLPLNIDACHNVVDATRRHPGARL